jgi:hypothetical protein
VPTHDPNDDGVLQPEEVSETPLSELPPELRSLLAVERINDQLRLVSTHVVKSLQASEKYNNERARLVAAEAELVDARRQFWTGVCSLFVDGVNGFGRILAEYSRDARIRWTVAAGLGVLLLSVAARCGVDPSALQGIGITVTPPAASSAPAPRVGPPLPDTPLPKAVELPEGMQQ